MKIKQFSALALLLTSLSAFAGDEVHNGSVAPKAGANTDDQFCMTDPRTQKEVCVPKSQKAELEKKMKDAKKGAPKTDDAK